MYRQRSYMLCPALPHLSDPASHGKDGAADEIMAPGPLGEFLPFLMRMYCTCYERASGKCDCTRIGKVDTLLSRPNQRVANG
jgi:hypothetical protein